jgi:O-antigen ligase
MYLTLLAETGLLGFSFFLIFIILLAKKALRRISTLAGIDRWRSACFLAGFAGMLACFSTFDGLYWIMPAYVCWMYAGIIDSA